MKKLNFKFQLVRYQRFSSDWKEIDVSFADGIVTDHDYPFTTLIIGGNGLGKSFILSCLLDDFRLAKSSLGKSRQLSLFDDFEEAQSIITYLIDDISFEVFLNRSGLVKATKNQIPIDHHQLILPNKLLALAFMVNDKFPFGKESHQSDDQFYEYLGTRGASNASWTNTIGKKTAETIIHNALNNDFLDALGRILNDMDFAHIVDVFFEFERLNQRTIDRFNYEYIEKQIERRSRSSFGSRDDYEKTDIQEIMLFIEKLRDDVNFQNKGISYQIGLSNSKTNKKLQKDYPILSKLNELRFISYPKLAFFKRAYPDTGFDFDNASSGEKHLLFSMIGLVANLQPGSLILVDEPELSLHPNWQTRYIQNLKQTLQQYQTCHFILATHSHLMVSDLEPDSSSVIVLKEPDQENLKKVVAKPLEYSTYGWSAENILLEVFGIPSSRNYYLSREISEVLVRVSDGTSPLDQETKERILDLIKIGETLKDVDPLKKVIKALAQALK